MTKTRVTLGVTLALCFAPGAIAHPRTHHAHTGHSHVTHPYGSAYPYGSGYQWFRSPGYGATLPPYTPYHGWDCVTDEGQGRYLPCEMGGG
jgi:hypothetical protein